MKKILISICFVAIVSYCYFFFFPAIFLKQSLKPSSNDLAYVSVPQYKQLANEFKSNSTKPYYLDELKFSTIEGADKISKFEKSLTLSFGNLKKLTVTHLPNSNYQSDRIILNTTPDQLTLLTPRTKAKSIYTRLVAKKAAYIGYSLYEYEFGKFKAFEFKDGTNYQAFVYSGDKSYQLIFKGFSETEIESVFQTIRDLN